MKNTLFTSDCRLTISKYPGKIWVVNRICLCERKIKNKKYIFLLALHYEPIEKSDSEPECSNLLIDCTNNALSSRLLKPETGTFMIQAGSNTNSPRSVKFIRDSSNRIFQIKVTDDAIPEKQHHNFANN